MRNKKSGSDDRVEGRIRDGASARISAYTQAHTRTPASELPQRTGLPLVTQGSKKFPGTGGRNSAHDAS